MKLQDNFTVCEIAGSTFVLPIGAEIVNIRAMLSLNESSAFIVEKLKEKELTREEMVDLIFEEFDADRERIKEDLDAFLKKAEEIGFITE